MGHNALKNAQLPRISLEAYPQVPGLFHLIHTLFTVLCYIREGGMALPLQYLLYYVISEREEWNYLYSIYCIMLYQRGRNGTTFRAFTVLCYIREGGMELPLQYLLYYVIS